MLVNQSVVLKNLIEREEAVMQKEFYVRSSRHPARIIAVAILLTGGLFFTALAVVYAHHGWAEFDQSKEITLTGTVEEPAFEYPHSTMILQTEDGRWKIQMAPPRRINRMGVNDENLYEGKTVTVVGHPHRENEKMMRIFEITIDGETLNIR